MLIDLIKNVQGDSPTVTPEKVAKGFAALVIDLMEHAPQLALLALAAYADFQGGNIPGMVEVVKQAAPVLEDIANTAVKQ